MGYPKTEAGKKAYAAAKRKWRTANPDKVKLSSQKYYKENKEKIKTLSKKRYKESPTGDKEGQLKHKYGITLQQYTEMVTTQGGVCYICKKPETKTVHGKVINLSVDHNHSTGQVRKLLCCRCNMALGLLGENPDRMRQLASYIEEYDVHM